MCKMKKISILFICILCNMSIMATQKYYVKVNGNDLSDGKSWVNAFATLTKAFSTAVSGAEICVGQGTFTSIATYSLSNKSFTLKGSYNNAGIQDYSAKTIINGNSIRVMIVGSTTTEKEFKIDGFIFKNGVSSGAGGAISFNKIAATISNCEFINNSTAIYGGGGVYFSSATTACTVKNCKFYNNSAKDGGAIYSGSGFTLNVINCTIVDNTATNSGSGGGGAIYGAGTINLYNTILKGNKKGTTLEQLRGAGIGSAVGVFNLDHNIIDGGKPTSNGTFVSVNNDIGIDANNVTPAFINNTTGDLHLLSNSPAINQGSNYLISLSDTKDVDNKQRICNTIVDLGCYEYFDKQIDGGGTINLDNNIIQGGDSAISNTITINNLTNNTKDVDPLFRNVKFGGFQLLVGSPAINAGTNDLFLSSFPQKDLENNIRFNNSTIDLGCYEYNSTAPYYIKADIQSAKTELVNKFTIYPNPAHDKLNIILISPVDMVKLSDLSGKCLLMKMVNANENMVELNVSGVSSGMYVLTVGCQTQKVIIK